MRYHVLGLSSFKNCLRELTERANFSISLVQWCNHAFPTAKFQRSRKTKKLEENEKKVLPCCRIHIQQCFLSCWQHRPPIWNLVSAIKLWLRENLGIFPNFNNKDYRSSRSYIYTLRGNLLTEGKWIPNCQE